MYIPLSPCLIWTDNRQCTRHYSATPRGRAVIIQYSKPTHPSYQQNQLNIRRWIHLIDSVAKSHPAVNHSIPLAPFIIVLATPQGLPCDHRHHLGNSKTSHLTGRFSGTHIFFFLKKKKEKIHYLICNLMRLHLQQA